MPVGSLLLRMPGRANWVVATVSSFMLTVAERWSGWAAPVVAAVVVVAAFLTSWVTMDCAGLYVVSPE
jgi:hypothetical protein